MNKQVSVPNNHHGRGKSCQNMHVNKTSILLLKKVIQHDSVFLNIPLGNGASVCQRVCFYPCVKSYTKVGLLQLCFLDLPMSMIGAFGDHLDYKT